MKSCPPSIHWHQPNKRKWQLSNSFTYSRVSEKVDTVKKSSKTEQERKTSRSSFANFLAAINKTLFVEGGVGDVYDDLPSSNFKIFLMFPNFLRS